MSPEMGGMFDGSYFEVEMLEYISVDAEASKLKRKPQRLQYCGGHLVFHIRVKFNTNHLNTTLKAPI